MAEVTARGASTGARSNPSSLSVRRTYRRNLAMAYDLVIRNAIICDGTGAPVRHGALAVKDGKIAAVGEAGGAVRAPGFIDIHTHYDAQISWDPLLTCSSWHGVTTLLMGNCGVGVAPCRPGQQSTMAWDLVNVEALPHEVLMRGVSWDWES